MNKVQQSKFKNVGHREKNGAKNRQKMLEKNWKKNYEIPTKMKMDHTHHFSSRPVTLPHRPSQTRMFLPLCRVLPVDVTPLQGRSKPRYFRNLRFLNTSFKKQYLQKHPRIVDSILYHLLLTRHFFTSDKRFARTHPAEPAPMMIKSNSSLFSS